MTRLKTLLLAGLFLTLAGCASLEKQRNRAEKFYKAHPEELAEKCAQNYPPTYKPGKEVEQGRDTVYLPGDSVPCPQVTDPQTGKVTTPKVKCPDSKTIYIPKLRVDTVESTALLARLEKQRQDIADLRADIKTANKDKDNANTERDKARGTAKNRLWVIIGLIVGIAGYIGFKIYRRVKI
jgi:hypothetical protein